MAEVIAVCTSKEKGTKKHNVGEGILQKNHGLAGDAHADCCSHRQVSLLDITSIDKMRRLGVDVNPGDFAENITTSGIDLLSLPVGTHISVGDEIMLEITQIGKECHSGCDIFQQVGTCIMPTEGVFARVIHGGRVKTGDLLRVERDG